MATSLRNKVSRMRLSPADDWKLSRFLAESCGPLPVSVPNTLRLKLPDAIHAVIALSADCPSTLSADTSLSGYYHAGTFRNGAWIEGIKMTSIIRPDSDTLRSILSWLRA